MAKRDGAASIQGDAIRITPLTLDGTIDTTKPVLTTNGFITASFGTEFEDGDEITEKAADGTICIQYKADDSMKGITFNLSLCSPDPESSALIAGGKVIVATQDVLLDPTQPAGPNNPIVVATGEPVGYSAPSVGASVGNPVAIEIWSKAIVKGKPASGQPYWHWAFPYVRVRYEGDREFTNGALANEFSGTGVGNEALVPNGLLVTGDDFVTYKEALANPFSYVRASTLPPMGWSGGQADNGEWTWTAENSIGPGFTGTSEVKTAAKAGDSFSAETTITAEDAANAALLAGLGYTAANAATPWTAGQSMRVGYYDFHWTGTAWQPGAVPIPATGAVAGTPGYFTPTGAAAPANIGALAAVTASPLGAWTGGQNVVTADALSAYWDGLTWVGGIAP